MQLAGKIALVTGASGFVGSRIARRLQREGMRVRALVRRPTDATIGTWEPCVGDVASGLGLAEATSGVDLVVHCAATLFGDEQESFRVNAVGTRATLAAAEASSCRRMIHLSTAAVYAFDNRDVVDEATPLRRDGNAYQRSKVEAERAIWSAGLAVTVFRPHVVLGAHGTAAWSTLLGQRMLRGEFVLHGDGGASLHYVHVDNLADAVVLAAQSEAAAGRAYNVVDGHVTVREYAERLRHWLGGPEPPARPELPVWRGRLEGGRAVRELGYAPRVGYEEAMGEIAAFLRGWHWMG